MSVSVPGSRTMRTGPSALMTMTLTSFSSITAAVPVLARIIHERRGLASGCEDHVDGGRIEARLAGRSTYMGASKGPQAPALGSAAALLDVQGLCTPKPIPAARE